MTQPYDENDPAIPTLTRRAGTLDDAISPGPLPNPLFSAVLQAEMERAVNRAINEAMEGVRRRLEKEIPAIVERTLRRVGTQNV